MKSLSVKAKMLLLSGLMVTGIVVLAAMLSFGMHSLVQIGQSSTLSSQAETTMQSLRINEKDFFNRLDLKYQTQFNENHRIIKQQLSDLDSQLKSEDIQLENCSNNIMLVLMK